MNFKKEVKENGTLPSHSFPGMYPIFYLTKTDNTLCAKCASKDVEDVIYHSVHWEGQPLICEECNAEIESAYGDPDSEVHN